MPQRCGYGHHLGREGQGGGVCGPAEGGGGVRQGGVQLRRGIPFPLHAAGETCTHTGLL